MSKNANIIGNYLISHLKVLTDREFKIREKKENEIVFASIDSKIFEDSIYPPFHQLGFTLYEEENKLILKYDYEHMVKNIGMYQRFNMFQIFSELNIENIKRVITQWLSLIDKNVIEKYRNEIAS